MRKLLATIVCFILAFSLGLTLLPLSFNALVNWLGPVFGTSLRLVLSTVFLLFADPLIYTTLIITWASVGFIGGLIIRKRIGSILSMLPVYTGQWLIVSLSGFRIFETIQASGILEQLSIEKLMVFLPPVPPGVSLATVLSAPVIGEITSRIPSDLTGLNAGTIVDILLGTLIFNMVKDIVILCVSALAGCEVGKLIERSVIPKIQKLASSRMALSQGPVEASTKLQTKVLKKPLLISILLILTLSTFSLPFTTAQSGFGSYYSEAIVGMTTPDGTAYVASLFMDTELPLSGISLNNPAFDGAVASILISQKITAAALPPILLNPELLSGILPGSVNIPTEILQDLTRYVDLIFPTIFVVVYLDVPTTTAGQMAKDAASAYSSAFDISLVPLSFPIPSTNVGGHVFAPFVYYSKDTLAAMSDSIMASLPANRGGLAGFVKTAYESGAFVDASGTVMFTGFVRSSSLWNMMEGESSEVTEVLKSFFPDVDNPLPVMGVSSYWINKYHSSTFNFNFSINELLNITKALEFSTFANLSMAASIVPNSTVSHIGETMLAPIIKVFTTAPISEGVLAELVNSLQNVTSIDITSYTPEDVAAGITIPIEAFQTAFTKLFPMNLQVEKTLSVSEIDRGDEIEVTITIRNNDTAPAKNVKLDDSFSLSFYPLSARLVEGTMTKEWLEIPAESSVSHTYKILLSREGVYTLPFALVSYNYTGAKFFAKSNPEYATIRSPSFFGLLSVGIPYSWNLAIRALNMIPAIQGNGQIILSGIVIVAIVGIALGEYMGYKKRNKKDEK